MQIIEMKIADIKIGKRFREVPEDVEGDIETLATSIRVLGQLQPIGITEDHVLIFGARRIRALSYLGHATVLARVITAESVLQAEYDENECRTEFTLSERVAIGKALEDERKRKHYGADVADQKKPQNFAGSFKGDTRELAARKAGFNNHTTYEQTKAVVETGVPELVAAMDAGDVAPSAAAQLAKLPVAEQLELVAAGKQEMKRAAKKLREKSAAAKVPDPDMTAARGSEGDLVGATAAYERLKALFADIFQRVQEVMAAYSASPLVGESNADLIAAIEKLNQWMTTQEEQVN